MSKIARLPIKVPQGINLKVSEDKSKITVSSQNTTLSYPFHGDLSLNLENNTAGFEMKSTLRNRTVKSITGSVYASVKRGIGDIQNKFTAKVQLKGVGYKATFANEILTLSLGFSHPVKIAIPKGIEIKITQNTLLEITGYDRRVVMDIAVTMRNLRKPEPYKGKGVFINDETITLKEGKKK